MGGFRFSAKDGTALLEAGGELLEEFVFHGNSGRKNLRITGTVEGMEIAQIEGEESFRTGFAGSKEVKVIVDRSTAHAAHFGFAEGRKEVVRVECNAPEFRHDLLAEQVGGIRCGEAEAETPAREGA